MVFVSRFDIKALCRVVRVWETRGGKYQGFSKDSAKFSRCFSEQYGLES